MSELIEIEIIDWKLEMNRDYWNRFFIKFDSSIMIRNPDEKQGIRSRKPINMHAVICFFVRFETQARDNSSDQEI